MRKSISSMYFSTTAALLIVSTAVLCAIQMYLVMGYFKQDKKESLSEVVSIVTSQIRLRQQAQHGEKVREQQRHAKKEGREANDNPAFFPFCSQFPTPPLNIPVFSD